METRGAPVGGAFSAEIQSSPLYLARRTAFVDLAENRPTVAAAKQAPSGEKSNSGPKQGSMASPGSAAGVAAESPKAPKMAKAGLNFVIPKNKLLGSMVPVNRSAAKWEPPETKKEEVKPQARKTKWGPDLTQDADVKRGRSLALQTRVEQVAAQLESGNLDIDNNEETRSPSPPPIYDTLGHRMNTRAIRKREQLDIERREAIGECIKLDSGYKTPSGYKPVAKEAKLYIPIKEHPGYNFIGLILGPRGNTQKRMEAETGAKITIRGKGAVKEGKMQPARNGKDLDGSSEEVHVHISAESFEKVDAAVALIEPLLTPVDNERNMHKMQQLRELAEMNGTLNDFMEPCSLCGETGHREWQCPRENLQNFQANVLCNICGDGGHPTIDCPRKNSGQGATVDKEYSSFMEELGTGLEAVTSLVTASQALGSNISQPMLLTTLGAQPIPARWMVPPFGADPSGIPVLRGPPIRAGDAGVFPRFPVPLTAQGANAFNPFVPRFYQTSAPVRGQLFPVASMPMMTTTLPAFRGQVPGASGVPPSMPVANAGIPLPSTSSTMPPQFQALGPAREMGSGCSPSFPRGSQSGSHNQPSNMNAVAVVMPTSAAPLPVQGTPDSKPQLQSSTLGPSVSSAATLGVPFPSNPGSNMSPVEIVRPVLASPSAHTISLSPAVIPSVRPVAPSIRPALSGSVVQRSPGGPALLTNAIQPIGGMSNVALPPMNTRPQQGLSGNAAFWSRPPPSQVAPSFDRPPSAAIPSLQQPFALSNNQPPPSPIQVSNRLPMAAPSNILASNTNLPPVSSNFTAAPPASQFVMSPNNSLAVQPGHASSRPGFYPLPGSQIRASNPGNTALTGSIQQMPIAQQNVFGPPQSPRLPLPQNTQFSQSNGFPQIAKMPPMRPPLAAQIRPEFRVTGMLQSQQGILVPPPPVLGNASLSRPLGPQGFTPIVSCPRNPIATFTVGMGPSNASSDPSRNQSDFQQMNGSPAMGAVRSWGGDPHVRPQPPGSQTQEVDPEYEKLMASVGVL